MASILARNGFYHAQYTDKNGKLHRRSTKIPVPAESKNKANKKGKKYLTQAEKNALKIAQTWEQEAKGTMKTQEAQAYLQAAARMVEESSPIAREWLSEYQPRGGEQNQLNSKRAIKLFLEFLAQNDIPNIRLAEIKKGHCMKFLGYQLQKKNLASGTVDSYKNHLSRAFHVAIENEILHTVNPFTLFGMRDVKLEFVPERKGNDKTKRRPFTMDEMKTILFEFPAPYNDLAAVSFFTCGQRIGDCISLKWNQIDFNAGTITFDTQKTGKHLELPLLPELRRRLEARSQSAEALDSPYVFPELNREARASKGAVSTRFTAYLDAFGIKRNVRHSNTPGKRRKTTDTSFHSIRYTCVSFLRAGGITADVSRAVVGHDSEAIQRGYFTLDLNQKGSAMAVLVNALESVL